MNGEKPNKKIYENQEEVRAIVIEYLKKNLFKYFSRAYLVGSLTTNKFGKYDEKYEGFFGSDIDLVVIPKQNMNKFNYKRELRDWHEYFGGKINIKNTIHPINLMLPIRQDLNLFLKKSKELNLKTIRLK